MTRPNMSTSTPRISGTGNRKWRWTRAKRQALGLVLDGLTDKAVAHEVGVSPKSIFRWRHSLPFAQELRVQLMEKGIRVKLKRLRQIEAFADAIESIPRTLAENAGLDPIDILIELRKEHKKGNKNAGINVFSGKVSDMRKENVIEPIRVGSQAISSATDAAVMILRIDDVIASKAGGAPGGKGGAGGDHGGDEGGAGEEF